MGYSQNKMPPLFGFGIQNSSNFQATNHVISKRDDPFRRANDANINISDLRQILRVK